MARLAQSFGKYAIAANAPSFNHPRARIFRHFCQCQYNRQRHFAFAKIAPDFLAGIAPFIIQTIINQLKSQTANLFEIAAAGPAILAGQPAAEKALSEYGKRLGLAFQLVDDCLDYEGGDTGKEVGRDFSEGKMTLPVILALAKMPEDARARMIEGWRIGGDSIFAETLRQTRQSGALLDTRARAQTEAEAAAVALELFDGFAKCDATKSLATLARTSPARTA